MPVIKQSTRSSNIIVNASGESAIQGSSINASSSKDFRIQKEKEYKIRLEPTIFKKSIDLEMLGQQRQLSSSDSRRRINLETVVLDKLVDDFDSLQRSEIQNSDSLFDSLSSENTIPQSRLNQEDMRIERLDQLAQSFDSNTLSTEFLLASSANSDMPRRPPTLSSFFDFTGLGKLIERSRKSLKNTNIKVTV